MRDIDGILYCNDGDWVESLTALVETPEGELRILTWHELMAATGGIEPARIALAGARAAGPDPRGPHVTNPRCAS